MYIAYNLNTTRHVTLAMSMRREFEVGLSHGSKLHNYSGKYFYNTPYFLFQSRNFIDFIFTELFFTICILPPQRPISVRQRSDVRVDVGDGRRARARCWATAVLLRVNLLAAVLAQLEWLRSRQDGHRLQEG